MNQQIDTSLFSRYPSQKVKKFLDYHYNNPDVYEEFKRIAREARKFYPKYSAETIFQKLRFERECRETGEAFKICDHYRSMYSRLLAQECPDQFRDFFRFKQNPAKTSMRIAHDTGKARVSVRSARRSHS